MKRSSNSYALAVAVVVAVGALLTACSFVVEVDGNAHSIRVLLPTSDAPPGSATPTPTHTPTATDTATPRATVTPSSTPTPAATDTPLYGTDAPPPDTLTPTPQPSDTPAFPTPTPDTLPSVTPGPSATPLPPPDDVVCMAGVVTNGNLNVRKAPSVNSAIVGRLAHADRVQVVFLWIQQPEGSGAREEWAQLADGAGWIALWYDGDLLAALDDAAPCWELPRDGPGSVPQPPDTAWGVWAGPGSSTDEVLAFITTLKGAGITPALTVYGAYDLARRAHDAGALVLVRPWLGDHPPYTEPAAASARDWVDRAMLSLGTGYYDCVVLSNEPIYPSAQYARDWIRAAILRADERGARCVVPVVFAPGHPELWAVDVLRSAYQDAPIPVFWGLNLYPVAPEFALSDRNALTQWTTYRWQLYTPPAPIIVTEFARGDGAQPPDFADVRQFVALTDGEFAVATAWYLAGPAGLGHWPRAVLWGRLHELAAAIVGGVQ